MSLQMEKFNEEIVKYNNDNKLELPLIEIFHAVPLSTS